MTANIFVTGVIGEDTTLQSVMQQYALYKKPSDVTVSIDSVGGDVREGYAIHDYLKGLGSKVTTKVVSKCYSIATVILLAGEERLMTPNAELMIHNPWAKPSTGGDAKYFQKLSEEMKRTEDEMTQFYAKHTKTDLNTMDSLMDKETYMSYKDAVKYGFITGESTQLKAVAKLNMQTENKEEVKNLFARIMDLLNPKAMSDEDEEKAKMDDDEKKAMEMKLEDGTDVFIDSEDGDFVDKQVFVVTPEGNVPAPNGEHTLSDGRMIVVEDGVIKEVKEAAPEANKEEMEELAKMKEELEALKAENESLKASKDKELQAKEDAIVAMKKETEEKFNALQGSIKDLKAMVVSEEAPKPVNKKPVDAAPKQKHKFDSLIA